MRRRSRGRVDLSGPVRAGLPGRRTNLPGVEVGPTLAARTHADAISMNAIIATEGTPKGSYGRREMTAHLRRQVTSSRMTPPTGSRKPWAGTGSAAVRGCAPRSRPRRSGRGPAEPGLHRTGAEPGLGRRLHLLPHLGRVRARRVRRRRVRPADVAWHAATDKRSELVLARHWRALRHRPTGTLESPAPNEARLVTTRGRWTGTGLRRPSCSSSRRWRRRR